MFQHRRYSPDVLFEVSQRTNRGECLIDCDDPAVRSAIDGILAKAQEKYGVTIYAYHFLANHYHGLFSAPTPQKFANFLGYFHVGVARFLNWRREQVGHVWGGRAHVIPVLPDEATLTGRLRYILGQATKAGLVAHPAEFAGPSSARWMIGGEAIDGAFRDRTKQCRDKRLKAGPKPDAAYDEAKTVQISPLPCWADLPADELHRRYRALADEVATTPNTNAPLCQTHEDTAELPDRAPTPPAVDEAGNPRVVGNVTKRAPLPRVLAADPKARQEFLDLLDAFEEAYSAARQLLNQHVHCVKGSVRLRLVKFPQYALVGGGVLGE